jgi:hypothetical protein
MQYTQQTEYEYGESSRSSNFWTLPRLIRKGIVMVRIGTILVGLVVVLAADSSTRAGVLDVTAPADALLNTAVRVSPGVALAGNCGRRGGYYGGGYGGYGNGGYGRGGYGYGAGYPVYGGGYGASRPGRWYGNGYGGHGARSCGRPAYGGRYGGYPGRGGNYGRF